MLYPLSYEGITGFSCLLLWSCGLHSTTSAQEVARSPPHQPRSLLTIQAREELGTNNSDLDLVTALRTFPAINLASMASRPCLSCC